MNIKVPPFNANDYHQSARNVVQKSQLDSVILTRRCKHLGPLKRRTRIWPTIFSGLTISRLPFFSHSNQQSSSAPSNIGDMSHPFLLVFPRTPRRDLPSLCHAPNALVATFPAPNQFILVVVATIGLLRWGGLIGRGFILIPNPTPWERKQ